MEAVACEQTEEKFTDECLYIKALKTELDVNVRDPGGPSVL